VKVFFALSVERQMQIWHGQIKCINEERNKLMFDRKDLQKKIEEQEEIQETIPEGFHTDDEREAKLRNIVESNNKWDTSGLKPNTRRKKIGIALLVAGLVGYLVLQYVIRGG